MGKISSPELINENHLLDAFDSGEETLDHWLKHRAINNHHNNTSKTFVINQDQHVIAYYCLAAGSVIVKDAPSKIKRNMPNPIPVMILGRLAVDKNWHGKGIGRGLLKNAVLRTVRISEEVGIKALLVHAISDSAKHFYKRFGFIESPLETKTLMLPLKEVII